MRAGVPRERGPGERRVAAVPATVAELVTWGLDVVVEHDAGLGAGFVDQAYVDAGATIVDSAASAHGADLVLRVGPPRASELDQVPEHSAVVGFLDPFLDAEIVAALVRRRLTGLAFEAVPRTTLAQSADALSSQATAAGYAAVLLAAHASAKFLPMLTTAAGTIPPARSLVLGVGVAGLQAIATLRRLGAVVHAYDIRTETREQVESLGAKFVAAPTESADAGGYAREVDDEVQRRQHEALAPYVAEADIVVTTAQIPGRHAPRLVTEDMVRTMHAGAVIVDMAAATGGNVAGSRPGEVVEIDAVMIHGPVDLPSHVAIDASRMLGKNVAALVGRLRSGDGFAIDLDDEVIGPTTVVYRGEVRDPRSASLPTTESAG